MKLASTSLLSLIASLGSRRIVYSTAYAYSTTSTTHSQSSLAFHKSSPVGRGVSLSHTDTRLYSSSSSTTASVSAALEGPDLPPVPQNSKRLFLVRHGEVINPGGDRPVYYGALDVELSSLGEQEAMAAGTYLSQFTLQHVASSPLKRARFGADQVLQRQGQTNDDETEGQGEDSTRTMNMKVYDGFTELDRGAWCGKTKSEIGDEMMERFDACDESATPDGGESYPTLKSRVLTARDELLDETDCGMASAVVSHLQVTRSMLSDAMGIPTEEMAALKIATASITCIDYDVESGEQTVHFQSFKPDAGLEKSKDGAN